MSHVLISVGVDKFDHLSPPLSGAETDAVDIFEQLVSSEYAIYDKDKSHVLRSPTYLDFNNSLKDLAAHEKIDVLTIYFASHGTVVAGTYFVCVRDTEPSSFSTTAISLISLFQVLNELQPSQCNIIIDACQAGGLAADTRLALRHENIGRSSHMALTIMCAADADQYAEESTEGGVATREILTCLDGSVPISTLRPYLDLAEVGRSVSISLEDSGESQAPIIWGLNLAGEARFARNPHYDHSAQPISYQVSKTPPGSTIGTAVSEHASQLWQLHQNIPDQVELPEFVHSIRPIFSDVRDTSPDQLIDFSLGIASTWVERSGGAYDIMLAPQLSAAVLAGLLGLERKPENLQVHLQKIFEVSERAYRRFENEMESEEFLLLSEDGGISDYYVLPLRISKILGWLASDAISRELVGESAADALSTLMEFESYVRKNYPGSLACISDSQTAYLVPFFALPLQIESLPASLGAFCEEIFGRICNDFLWNKGRIARADASGKQAIGYMIARSVSVDKAPWETLANPISLLAMLLQVASHYKLDEVIDCHLRSIDRTALNVFVPSNYADFAEESMRDGRNMVAIVGDGIWTTDDFRQYWGNHVATLISGAADPGLVSPQELAASIYSSQLMPDRVPWFLLELG